MDPTRSPLTQSADIDLLTAAVRPRIGGMTAWFDQMAVELAGRGRRVRLIALTDRVEGYEDSPFEVVPLPVGSPSKSVFPWLDKWMRWRSARREWESLRLSSPRIRISDGTPGVLDFAARLSGRDGAPWVVVMGGDVFEETRGLPFASLFHGRIRATLLRADRILVDGPDLVEALTRRGVPAEKVRIHFRGIDPVPDSERRRETGIPRFFPDRPLGENFRMVWHGRLSSCHGPERFLEVARKVPEAVGRMAGSGEPSDAMKEALGEGRFGGWFLGRLSDGDLVDLLGEADCGVYPLEKMAGIPTVLLESMAAGLATVTLPTGSCRELIRHETNGLIAADLEEMAACVERLRGDPDLGRELGRNAMETIRKDWSVGASLDRLEKWIGELIER